MGRRSTWPTRGCTASLLIAWNLSAELGPCMPRSQLRRALRGGRTGSQNLVPGFGLRREHVGDVQEGQWCVEAVRLVGRETGFDGRSRAIKSAKERPIGFYHTGPQLRSSDLEISERLKRFMPRPVSRFVNPMRRLWMRIVDFSVSVCCDTPFRSW
jgi:hypothetical protein